MNHFAVLDTLGLNTSTLDISMHVTTYSIIKWYVNKFYLLINQHHVGKGINFLILVTVINFYTLLLTCYM